MKKTIITLIILIILALGLAALVKHTTPPPIETPVASVDASYLGTWTGVEGTMLTVDAAGDGYALSFIMLDGPISVAGLPAADGGIAFMRDGQSFVLHHGTGLDTGMKYLTDKQDCLVIQAYEGYCRD